MRLVAKRIQATSKKKWMFFYFSEKEEKHEYYN